ncbi:MAG: lysophospholipid acyltransferase family protein [Burkholderiales bacterium]|nr:lysophospholipid acyltransferase family protein [Burkholderiales bacterium]
MIVILRQLARLPLSVFHAIGALGGRLAYALSGRYARRLRANLKASGLCATEAEYRRVLRANIDETGRQAIETIPLWFRDQRASVALVRSVRGEDLVREAHAAGRGVILLTPHLGCFEVAALYAAQSIPITVLYRPPRVQWLHGLIESGRGRGNVRLAPASASGVRRLLKALRSGEAIGVLPDQVPRFGEGVWVDFFGRPAYTMTLIGRLCELTRPAVFVAAALRRPHAGGYDIEVEPVHGDLSGVEGVRRMNAAIERMVARCPEQYLWAYSRHKRPPGAPPPPERE